MGRHFCKLCSSSHDLPAIQPRGGKGFSLSASRTLQICASHTSPTLFLADVPDLPGHSLKLTVSDADFSCQHQVSTLALEIPLGGLKCGGHWSLVFEAFEGRSKDGRQDKGRGLRSGKHMVVKVYKEQGSQTQGQIFDRFHRELTALGTLSEMPGVVRCVGFGFTADKWPYIVMEHAGTPLSIMLSMPIFPVSSQAQNIARELLSALEAAHTLGLAHNDLHTENIMVQEGVGGRVRMLIVDWNSVEECCLRGDDGQHLGQGQNWGFFIDPDAMDNALRGGSVETSAVIRDCQAAGRVLLACVDKALYARLFGGLFMGTLNDWTGAAQGVAASRLSAPWRDALPPLLAPRNLPKRGGCTVYPIQLCARIIATGR